MNGACTDGENAYTCSCDDKYMGTNCAGQFDMYFLIIEQTRVKYLKNSPNPLYNGFVKPVSP